MTTEEKTNHVEVKASFLYWQYLLFFSSILFFAAVISFLSRNNTMQQNLWSVLIFGLLCLGTHYLTIYLTKSQTIISLANGLLTIKQTSNKINKENFITLETNQIRGFEVAHLINGYPNLIIYLNTGKYLCFLIYKTSESSEVKSLLANELEELTSKSNPSFKNYGSAFLFVLRQIFICTALILLIIYGVTYQQSTIEDFGLLNIPLCLAIILICWLLVISIPARKKNFRYYGFAPSGNLVFLLLTVIAFVPIIFRIKTLKKEVINVSSVNEILIHPKNDIFIVKNTSFTSQKNLYYRAFVKKSGRSMKFRVDHVFVTPIISSTLKEPIQVINFWLAKEYVQSIRKNLDSTLKEKAFREFATQSHREFINDLQKKPSFYIVVYNKSTNKGNQQTYEVARSSGMTNSTIIILEPHWETISSYRKNIKTEILWFAIAIIAFNIIGAATIAGQR